MVVLHIYIEALIIGLLDIFGFQEIVVKFLVIIRELFKFLLDTNISFQVCVMTF